MMTTASTRALSDAHQEVAEHQLSAAHDALRQAQKRSRAAMVAVLALPGSGQQAAAPGTHMFG